MNVIYPLMKMGFMMHKNREFAKKRMMFIPSEDYNFLTYNLLILLKEMGCTSKETSFQDFKKIAFLIDFISSKDGDLIDNNIELEDQKYKKLKQIYQKSHLKKQLLTHIIVALKNKKYLDFDTNTTHYSIDIWINESEIPKDFFDKQIFKTEMSNIKKIKKVWGLRKNTALKTLLEKLFEQRGVQVWEV